MKRLTLSIVKSLWITIFLISCTSHDIKHNLKLISLPFNQTEEILNKKPTDNTSDKVSSKNDTQSLTYFSEKSSISQISKNYIDKRNFDTECKCYVREKRKPDEALKNFISRESPHKLLQFTRYDIRYFYDLLDKNKDLLIYISFNYPYLPDDIEGFLYKILFNVDRMQRILDRSKYPSYYNVTDAILTDMKKRLKETGIRNEDIDKITIYIYSSSSKNGYSLPNGKILISSEAVKSLIGNDTKKRKQKITDKKEKTKKNVIHTNSTDRIFLEFLIAHEVMHELKKHNTLKLQALMFNPLIDTNIAVFKDLKELFFFRGGELENPAKLVREMEIINYHIELANKSNLDRLKILTELLEMEADACALRYLMSKYDKKVLKAFFQNDFDKYFQGQVNVFEVKITINQRDPLYKLMSIKNLIENIDKFIQTFILLEHNEHIDFEKRKRKLIELLSNE